MDAEPNDETVHFEVDGPVCVITLDRPHARNAVDGPTQRALSDAFRQFEADDSLSVAILTGAGGTFCAGADLKAVANGRGNRVESDMILDAFAGHGTFIAGLIANLAPGARITVAAGLSTFGDTDDAAIADALLARFPEGDDEDPSFDIVSMYCVGLASAHCR